MALTRTRPHTWLVAALLAVAAVLLAACGGSSDGADPGSSGEPASQTSETTAATVLPGIDSDAQALLERVADKAKDLDAVSLSFELDAVADGEQVTARGHAAIDMAGERGTFSLDLDAAAMGGQPLQIEGVVDDQVLYVSGPFITQMLGATTPWVSLPLEQLDDEDGPAAGIVDPDILDPDARDQAFDALKGLEVKIVGDATVDGDDVTHVQAVLPLEDVLGTFGSMTGTTEAVPSGTQVDPVVVDIYVTGDDELRRISVEGRGSDGDTSVSIALLIDFESYDTDIDVTVPASDQVTDLGPMMSGEGGFSPFGGFGMVPEELEPVS